MVESEGPASFVLLVDLQVSQGPCVEKTILSTMLNCVSCIVNQVGIDIDFICLSSVSGLHIMFHSLFEYYDSTTLS